jgi:hypothetical protein
LCLMEAILTDGKMLLLLLVGQQPWNKFSCDAMHVSHCR